MSSNIQEKNENEKTVRINVEIKKTNWDKIKVSAKKKRFSKGALMDLIIEQFFHAGGKLIIQT